MRWSVANGAGAADETRPAARQAASATIVPARVGRNRGIRAAQLANRAARTQRRRRSDAVETRLPATTEPIHIRATMERLIFRDGDVIFHEGETSNGAYLVMSGVVEIVQSVGSARRKVIATLGKGQYFGEMGAIDDHPRSATAYAKGPV